MESTEFNKTLYTSNALANNYTKYRPVYSKCVFNKIANFCKEKSDTFDLAVDVGCGPGMSTVPLKEFFSKVIGVDVSQQQISHAPKDVDGVTFCVADCEHLSFIQSGSVDLVTVATAVHWFNLDRFYSEVRRILKPGGAFVVYSYNLFLLKVEEHKQMSDYISQIYRDIIRPRIPSYVARLGEDSYSSLPDAFGPWIRDDSMSLKMDWTFEHLIGLVSSFSTLEIYSRENPEIDIMEQIRTRLTQLYLADVGDMDKPFRVTSPFFMLMASKP